MAITLNGIILFAQDVDKLKHFYIDNFDLELVNEIKSEWVLLKAGFCELGLHKIGSEYIKSVKATGGSESNTKIVFEIDEDIFSIHKKLEQKHIILSEVKTWDNYPYLICDGEDSEGNVFQLRMKKSVVS